MKLHKWEKLAQDNPLHHIVTTRKQWNLADFERTGFDDVEKVMDCVDMLGLVQRKRVLDFGCGVGRLSKWLSFHFDEVVGVDISPTMIEIARRMNQKQNCVFHVSDGVEFLEPESFDCIVSLLVLQHIPLDKRTEYLKQFEDLLVPDGLLVFQMATSPRWNIAGLLVRVVMMFNRWSPMEMYVASRKELLDTLTQCDLAYDVAYSLAQYSIDSFTYYFRKRGC